MNLVKVLAVLFFMISATPSSLAEEAKVDAKTVVDAEQEQVDRLIQAQKLIASGKQVEAIALIDQTLAYYEKKFPVGETRWYVARTTQETLFYMVQSAALADSGKSKKNASALTVAWANAYFLKGYAYVELNQANEAKSALKQALELSPQNARYLIELAEAAKLERNWDESFGYYKEAESASAFSPADEKASDLSHSKRGQAFVFIEQGKFDEAEKMLKECLKLDADDQRAKEELEYIQSLRKK